MSEHMDDAEFRARAAEVRAAYYRYLAGVHTTAAASIRTSDAMKRLGEAIQHGTDRDVAEHPDLAELNIQLDNRYNPPGGSA